MAYMANRGALGLVHDWMGYLGLRLCIANSVRFVLVPWVAWLEGGGAFNSDTLSICRALNLWIIERGAWYVFTQGRNAVT